MMGRKKVKGAELQTRRFSAAMITPTVIVLAVMTAYPLIFTLVYSFTDYNLLGALNSAPEVVGAKNYLDLLTDPFGPRVGQMRTVWIDHRDGIQIHIPIVLV